MPEIRRLTAEEFCRCGAALAERHRLDAAIACFQRAVDLEPEKAENWYFLGTGYLRDGRYDRAADALNRSRRIDPDFHGSAHQLGMVYCDVDDFTESIRWFNRAAELNPGASDIELDRSLALLRAGIWDQGFYEYEARLKHLPHLFPKTNLPMWRGEAFDGTIHVYAEQGAGDIIMFSRYLAWLGERYKGDIVLDVPPEIRRLFMGWPGITVKPRDKDKKVEADCWIPMMSLPRLAGTTVDNVPADPGWFKGAFPPYLVDFLKPAEGVLKVGICWAGNPMHSHDRSRSVALEHFLQIASNPKIQLYSFQVGQRAGDIKLVGADPLVYDLGAQLTSWEVTAAALQHMDLVISVDTAVAHLAGALDVPVWLLLPPVADWRWLTRRSDTPWYPHMRLVRRDRHYHVNGWRGVLEQIASELKHRPIKQP